MDEIQRLQKMIDTHHQHRIQLLRELAEIQDKIDELHQQLRNQTHAWVFSSEIDGEIETTFIQNEIVARTHLLQKVVWHQLKPDIYECKQISENEWHFAFIRYPERSPKIFKICPNPEFKGKT